jgi:hypothetical protein
MPELRGISVELTFIAEDDDGLHRGDSMMLSISTY